MIRWRILTAAAAVITLTGSSAWADPLPSETHKVLTATLAVEAAQAAIAHCKAQGYANTAVVADAAGKPIVTIVGDGARYVAAEVTRRKAYPPRSGKCRPGTSPSGFRRRPALIPVCMTRSLLPARARSRSWWATTSSAPSPPLALRAATRMKPAPSPGWKKSRTG